MSTPPDNRSSIERFVPGILVAACLLLATPRAVDAHLAEWVQDPVTLELHLLAEAGYFHAENTGFGAGRARDDKERLDWVEMYALPSGELTYRLPRAGELFGGASIIGSLSRGDADLTASTFESTEYLDLEHLYVGWRSSEDWLASGSNGLELSVGRQDLLIGDGFLIQDGNVDARDEGTAQLVARDAFALAAIGRATYGPWHGGLFYLEADEDHGHPSVAGVNAEWRAQRASVGVLYLRVLDADPPFAARDGLNTWSVRGDAHPLPSRDLRLAFEYVHQRNERRSSKVRAHAGHAEIEYQLSWLRWTPWLRYRYAWFGGDDPDTVASEAFDPLFYGDHFERGWGTWSQGEIVGAAYLFNSNQTVHHVHLHADLSETVAAGAMYWHFALEQPRSFFANSGSARAGAFADELDVYVDWTVTDTVSVSPVGSIAFPAAAAEHAFGDDEPILFFQLYLALAL
ncbi:MAG TPA: hypothetical protein VEC57_15815 [Candidatus Limnocylindrales bacterium]|nr:hypothetical protein [Candidatus Limnocylindrales bacterium]